MSIYKKLNEARTEFHSLKLKKTGHNKFAGYYYFELADFLIPALSVFAKHGLCAIVNFTADTATMRIHDIETGESVELTSPMGSAALKGCHEVQNIGAVETYQRRYLWVAALEIVEHDALDSVTGSDRGEPAKSKPEGQPTSGVWEALDEESQAVLLKVAANCQEYFDVGDIAGLVEYIESKNYDADLKTALWTRLGSKLRTAIKKEINERKEAA
jgi:hypothetical protein